MGKRQDFEQILLEIANRRTWTIADGQVEVSLKQGRRQTIEWECFEYGDDSRVRLFTQIGSVKRIPQERLISALEMSFGLPHAAMAIHADTWVLVETLSLAEVTPNTTESLLTFMAETADYYEETIFGPDAN